MIVEGDIIAEHEDYLPVLREAMRTLSGSGLPKLAEFANETGARTGYSLRPRLRSDGSTRYMLDYRLRNGDSVRIGIFVINPHGAVRNVHNGSRRKKLPVRAPHEPVVLENGQQVYVILYKGQPAPLPVEQVPQELVATLNFAPTSHKEKEF